MQERYVVEITEPVQKWIDDLLEFSMTLDSQEAKKTEKQIIEIYKKILTLKEYPYRIKIAEENGKILPVRRIDVNQYAIYFDIKEGEKVVNIVAITYVKGDQLLQLSDVINVL